MVFLIWQQAFSAIKSISKSSIIHRDISFRNIRIDDQGEVKVCDFDMATDLDAPPTGVPDRTGTVAFMATAMLSDRPITHRPVHDCESVFWLCAIDLLRRVADGILKSDLAQIMNPASGIFQVSAPKRSVISALSPLRETTRGLESYASLDSPKDRALFFCLATLAKEFYDNDHVNDFANADEGFEENCFDRCIKIIEEADLKAVEKETSRGQGGGADW